MHKSKLKRMFCSDKIFRRDTQRNKLEMQSTYIKK